MLLSPLFTFAFSPSLFIYLFFRKINPELTSAADSPLLFLLRKTGHELTSVPIFLYFICGAPARAWLAKWRHVCTRDLNWWTLGRQSRTCELNRCATVPAPLFSVFEVSFHILVSAVLRWGYRSGIKSIRQWRCSRCFQFTWRVQLNLQNNPHQHQPAQEDSRYRELVERGTNTNSGNRPISGSPSSETLLAVETWVIGSRWGVISLWDETQADVS